MFIKEYSCTPANPHTVVYFDITAICVTIWFPLYFFESFARNYYMMEAFISMKGKWISSALLLLLAPVVFALVWIYQVDPGICNGCGRCIPYCSTGALTMYGGNAVIDPALCNGCGDCVYSCIRGAIYKYWYTGISDDEAEAGFIFGPNPTAGPVLLTDAAPGSEVEVYDLCGRLVAAAAVSQNGEASLDLSGLESGAYLLSVDDSVHLVTLSK
jgi:ferredoxin